MQCHILSNKMPPSVEFVWKKFFFSLNNSVVCALSSHHCAFASISFRNSLVCCSINISNHPKPVLLCNYHLQQIGKWLLQFERSPFSKQTWLSSTTWLQKQESNKHPQTTHYCQQNNKTLCTVATICLICLYTCSSKNYTKAAFTASYNLHNENVSKKIYMRKQLPSHVLHFPSQVLKHSLQGSRSY